jgi:hypothetical protein
LELRKRRPQNFFAGMRRQRPHSCDLKILKTARGGVFFVYGRAHTSLRELYGIIFGSGSPPRAKNSDT